MAAAAIPRAMNAAGHPAPRERCARSPKSHSNSRIETSASLSLPSVWREILSVEAKARSHLHDGWSPAGPPPGSRFVCHGLDAVAELTVGGGGADDCLPFPVHDRASDRHPPGRGAQFAAATDDGRQSRAAVALELGIPVTPSVGSVDPESRGPRLKLRSARADELRRPDGEAREGSMLESMEPTSNDASPGWIDGIDGSDVERRHLFRSEDKAHTEDRASICARDTRLAHARPRPRDE
jgi:hypothetical protein